MPNFYDTKIFKKISKQRACYFISPHLDDAVFSAGGVIHDLKKKGIKMKVINVFTKADIPPYTISARKFINACGYNNAKKLFEDRIAEDKKVLDVLKTEQINLGYTDALWRKKKNKNPFGIIIPELNHVYPFFHTSIAKGIVSSEDNSLIKNIQKSLSNIVKGSDIVFCPAGIGNHTDHIITRNVCVGVFPNLIFWSDYPYNTKNDIDRNLVAKNRLLEYNHKIDTKVKTTLVNMYKTQIKAIFGVEKATALNTEKYWSYNENT